MHATQHSEWKVESSDVTQRNAEAMTPAHVDPNLSLSRSPRLFLGEERTGRGLKIGLVRSLIQLLLLATTHLRLVVGSLQVLGGHRERRRRRGAQASTRGQRLGRLVPRNLHVSRRGAGGNGGRRRWRGRHGFTS